MSLRIVFMGTPEFAVPSLRILVENGYEVAGVVTATDKLGGRGKKQLLQPAVKKYALGRGIPVLQPEKLKDPGFLDELKSLKASLFVVVAFRMLPEAVWAMPEYGTINLHGSLLPKYRGAAPINWAIINGERETGATTFFIRKEIDTGDILFQEKMAIGEHETAGEIHDRMMELGAKVVLKTVRAIEQGNFELKKHDDNQASPAPKIFHEDCEIDFNQPGRKVYNFIRGLSPYPAAWTTLDGKQFKILRATMEVAPHELKPGAFLSDNREWLKIATADGYIRVLELQLEGRRRMEVQDFLNGYFF